MISELPDGEPFMEGEPLRVGVVGCGSHATKAIFPNLDRANMKLVAACDLNEKKAKQNVNQFGGEQAYIDYDAMFDRDDLEAILICGHPVEMHYRIGIDALEAGYDTYTEKPPSRSASQSYEAWQTSKETGNLLMGGFKKRYSFSYPTVKEWLSAGQIGQDIVLNVNYQKGSQDNYVTDSAVHILDLVRFLRGDVEAVNAHHIGGGNEITFAIKLWFENGTVGLMEVSSRRTWDLPGSVEHVELTGSEGFITVDNTIEYKLFREGELVEWHKPNFISRNPYVSGLEPELMHFVQCVRGETKCRSDARNSYKTMELCEAVQDSEGTLVELGD